MKTLLILLLAVPVLGAERTHTVVPGDHLWGLSKHYYANPYKWRAIHNANTWIKDPHWIYPKQILVIPGMEVAEVTPDEPFPPAPAQPAPPAELETVFTPPTEDVVVGITAPQRDSLSTEFPENLSGQYPSMSRLMAPKGWSADGEVATLGESEALAAQGDFIAGSVKGPKLKPGDLLYVLRSDAPEDDDQDQKAKYFLRVGLVEVRQSIPGPILGSNKYKLLILKSGDSLQVGDVLSRRPL
jgi:hypothetical protein